ncbi:MAG: hypothetical protein HC902_13970 [Calothrix sp. SM1_5_4]|nr:hypothetical protein [Calothrix sp. SM1_5_4]
MIACTFSSVNVHVVQISSVLMGANALASATGYIFRTDYVYGFPPYEASLGMAIHTSIGFMFQAVALLLSRPREGLMELVTSDTRSGGMARKILFSVTRVTPLVIAAVDESRRRRGAI